MISKNLFRIRAFKIVRALRKSILLLLRKLMRNIPHEWNSSLWIAKVLLFFLSIWSSNRINKLKIHMNLETWNKPMQLPHLRLCKIIRIVTHQRAWDLTPKFFLEKHPFLFESSSLSSTHQPQHHNINHRRASPFHDLPLEDHLHSTLISSSLLKPLIASVPAHRETQAGVFQKCLPRLDKEAMWGTSPLLPIPHDKEARRGKKLRLHLSYRLSTGSQLSLLPYESLILTLRRMEIFIIKALQPRPRLRQVQMQGNPLM